MTQEATNESKKKEEELISKEKIRLILDTGMKECSVGIQKLTGKSELIKVLYELVESGKLDQQKEVEKAMDEKFESVRKKLKHPKKSKNRAQR